MKPFSTFTGITLAQTLSLVLSFLSAANTTPPTPPTLTAATAMKPTTKPAPGAAAAARKRAAKGAAKGESSKKKKNSTEKKKAPNYTYLEDKLLAIASVNVSCNSVTGNDQKAQDFWKAVHKGFSDLYAQKDMQEKDKKGARDIDSIQNV